MNNLKVSAWGSGAPIAQMEYDPIGRQPSIRKPRQKRTRQIIWDWWIYEILSLLVCCTAMIALVIVLRRYDGKPLGSWPWGINPNALVSAFATVIKMMAMVPVADCLGQLKWIWFSKKKFRALTDFEVFDSASRGVRGSIWLLVRLRFIRIASLGAFITIISVAADPLAQQAITTPHREVAVPGTAAVLRADNYSMPVGGLTDGDDYRVPPNTLVGAAYIGLYTPIGQTVPFPDPICTTGNCTFQPYSSLGICTDTKRIPNDVVRSTCEECMRQQDWESQCHGMCRSIPTNFVRMTVLKNGVLSHYSTIDDPALMTESESIAFPEYGWPLANIFITYKNDITQEERNSSQPSANKTTFETIFYYCAQEFQTSVVNGNVSTNLTRSSVVMLKEDPEDDGTAPELLIRPADKPDAKPFVVDPDVAFTTGRALFKIFQGRVGRAGVTQSETETARVLSLIVDQTSDTRLTKPNDYDALPGIMQNVATSMTNDMKLHPGNGTRPIFHEGTTWATETYIRVDWPWLSLLIATVPLSMLLLALTMMSSLRTQTQVWKTSSYPVLQALDETVKQDLGDLNNLLDAEARSDEIHVRLKKERGNWSLAQRN